MLDNQWDLIDKQILQHPETDTLRGLNIISYLSIETNSWMDNHILPLIKEVIGDSWAIKPEDRHITIVDLIPHNSMMGFTDKKLIILIGLIIYLIIPQNFSQLIFVYTGFLQVKMESQFKGIQIINSYT